MDAQLAACILDVKIDGALRQTEYAPGFPACLANGYPLQACEFALCKRLHMGPFSSLGKQAVYYNRYQLYPNDTLMLRGVIPYPLSAGDTIPLPILGADLLDLLAGAS